MDASDEGDRDLARFVQETADALAGPGLSEQELLDLTAYMQALAAYCGAGNVGTTTGGLLFAVNAQGEANYTPIRDVRELAMTPQLVLERHMSLKREMEQKLSLEQELRPTLRHNPGLRL